MTDQEYHSAITRLDALWPLIQVPHSDEVGEEFERLLRAVEAYELVKYGEMQNPEAEQ